MLRCSSIQETLLGYFWGKLKVVTLPCLRQNAYNISEHIFLHI